MKLKNRLKLEKEVYFLKYIISRPFYSIGGAVSDLLVNPHNWLVAEIILFFGVVFRKSIAESIFKYPMIIDKFAVYIILLFVLTLVIKAYISQKFQNEYKKEKEDSIKYD